MDTPQLLSTSADDEVVPDTTTSDEKEVASETASADEKVESKSSSGDEKDLPEIAPQEEEEEEEECGFCIFMKAGPCRESFKIWQDCVEGAEKLEKDIVERCAQTTNLLKVCMEMNPQYYGPVLDAEKAMQADIESAEGTRADVGQSTEPPTEGEGEGVVAGGNDDQTIEVVERVDVVVDDKGQVVEVVDTVEAEVKVSEGTLTDGGRSPEPPAEGEGVVESVNGDQTIEAVERVDVLIDDKGQVVEVVDDVEIEIAA